MNQIAQQLKEKNIAEYLIYMWQEEDLIRANHCEPEEMEANVIARYPEVHLPAMREWYTNLITMMGEEGVPPNPTELLARDGLDKAIETLKKNFEYVILDTAPVGMVTDTLLIGRVADLSVYVCRADYTHKNEYTLINELAEKDKFRVGKRGAAGNGSGQIRDCNRMLFNERRFFAG